MWQVTACAPLGHIFPRKLMSYSKVLKGPTLLHPGRPAQCREDAQWSTRSHASCLEPACATAPCAASTSPGQPGGTHARTPLPWDLVLTANPARAQGQPVSVMHPLLNASRNNLCFLAERTNSRSAIHLFGDTREETAWERSVQALRLGNLDSSPGSSCVTWRALSGPEPSLPKGRIVIITRSQGLR